MLLMKRYLLIIFLFFTSFLNTYAQCNATNDVLGNPGQPGLIGEYFAGYFNDDFSLIPNTISGTNRVENNLNYTTNNWGISRPPASGSATDQDTYTARYRGSINITTAGSYTFYMNSDDASYMYIDNSALGNPTAATNPLINNGGLHGVIEVSNTIYLTTGFHNIQILFGENTGGNYLTLEYSGPSIARQIVPKAALCTGIQPAIVAPVGCVCKDIQGNPGALGLLGEYYAGYFNDVQTFFSSTTPGLTRTESTINYNTDNGWGNIVPPATGSTADPNQFSTRWTGSIYLPVAGTYTFYLTSDDASYLWLNDSAIVANPTSATAVIQNGGAHSATTISTTVTLPAGLNNLKIHYGENGGNNRAILEYQNTAAGISRQVVPSNFLCTSYKVPNAPVVVSPLTYCQNATAPALTATGTNLLWYTVATGGVGSSTAIVPSTAAVGTISYYVSQSPTGCEGPRAKIDVTITTTPNLVITNPAGVCSPSTVNLTLPAVTAGSTGGGVLTYWNDAAATSALTTPTAVATSNTYYIKSTITATGCFDIKPVVVTINPKPNLVITNPAAVCAPSTVDLTAGAITAGSTGGGTLSYWNDAATTSSLSTPAAVATSNTYYIETTTAASCTDVKAVVVTINPKPNLVITDPTAVCSPGTIDLTAGAVTTGSTGGGTLTYWNDVAATSSLATPTAVATSNTYYIKSTITATGCFDIKPVVVTINPKPNLVITDPSGVCSPGTVDLTAAVVTAGSTGGGTLSYWNDAATTSSLSTPAAVATSNTYYIKTTTAASCIDVKAVVVTINTSPSLVITDPTPTCSTAVDLTDPAVTVGSTTGGTLSYWTDAAATVALASPNMVTVSNTYYIKLTTAANCSDIKPVVVSANNSPTLNLTKSDICGTLDTGVIRFTTTVAGLAFDYSGGNIYSGSVPPSYNVSIVGVNAITGLPSGTYTVRLQDLPSGCYTDKTITILPNTDPVLVITNPSVCAPATVDLTLPADTIGSSGGGTLSYWTNAAATLPLATPTSVGTGTYYIKATTASGCTDIKPIVATVNPQPNLVITDPAAVCTPSTVDITLPAVTAGSTGGGTLTYWNDLAATSALTTPAAIATSNTYYIKAAVSTCTDIKPVVVTINTSPVLTITDPAAVCSPTTVDITDPADTVGSSGYGTLTYWNNLAATSVLAGPSAIAVGGTYYIKLTTAANCTDIKPIVVTINASPNLVITDPAAVCTPATVDITNPADTVGSSNAGPLTYWTDAAATLALATPTAISVSNTYYIKSTTAANCTDIKPIVVTINPGPNLVITDPAAVCSPTTIDITDPADTVGSSGSGTLTYWNDLAATSVLAGPSAIAVGGTYYIKLTTAANCTDIKPIVVTINASPNLVITDPAAVCTPATVDITNPADTVSSSNAGPLTYWTDAAATLALATPTAISVSNTYYIKSTTAANCTDIKPIVVTINTSPVLTITDPATVCSPTTVDITDPADTVGSSGSGTLTYWNDLAATSVLAGPSAIAVGGTYYIKLTTAANCTDIKPIVVTINASPNLVITDPAAVCTPATVDITNPADTVGSSNAGPLTYWTDAAATLALATPTAISVSNTYYIKSTTAANCTDIKPIVVTINSSPNLVITDPAPTCTTAVDLTDPAVTVGSTGGGTLSYWTDAATTTALASPNMVNVSNTYYIKSTLGTCYDVKPVVVSANNSPVLNLTNSDICGILDTGVIRFNTTVAGLGYDYSGGITYTGSIPPSFGTSVVGVNSITNLTNGPYTVRLQDLGSGCYTDQVITINRNTNPNLIITDPSVCSPATVNLTIPAVTAGSTGSGTLTYWTDAAATSTLTTPASVGAGTYYIKSTTVAGCTDIKPVVATINTSPGLVITDPSPVCIPSTVDLTDPAVTAGSSGAGTLTYWTDAAATIALTTPNLISSSGTYYIKTSTPAGCSDIKPVNVAINSNPILVVTDPAAVCSPSVVNITSSSVTAGSSGGGVLSYWTDAAATVALAAPSAISATGTYYIEATTAGGCTDIKPVNVIVNTSPSLVITDPVSVCTPGTVDITTAAVTAGSTGGGTLTYWTDAAATSSLATPAAVTIGGVYYIESTTAANCTDIKPVNVSIVVAPNLVITNPAATCSTAVDITLPAVTAGSTGGGVLSYWADPGATVALASPNVVTVNGTYYIESTIGGGCSDIKPVVVSANNIPVYTLSKSDICGTVDNGTLSITTTTTGYAYDFTGGLSYTGPFSALSYTTAGTSVIGFGLAQGPYTARVVDTATMCYSDQTVTINVATIPVLTLSSTDACEISSTGTISFNLSAANYKYGYNSGFTYTGPTPPPTVGIIGTNTINSLAAGDYTVYLEDTLSGCSIDQSITINTVIKPSNYSLTGGGTICQGDTATIVIGMLSSETGVSYQLQLAGANIGVPVAGTSAAFNFPGANAPGAYNILAFVTSSPVCSTNINGTVSIVVNPKPIIDSIAASCSGGAGILKVYSTYSAGTPEYSIDGGAFQSSGTFSSLSNGYYTIVMRDNVTHCSDTLIKNVYCNNPPVTGTDYSCVPTSANASGNVTLNDIDPDGDSLKVTSQSLTTANGGIFTLDSTGNYTYAALAGYEGADTITYYVCDNSTVPACSFGNLIFLVGTKRIVATYDTASTLENTSLASSISIFANDTVSIGNSIVFTSIKNNSTQGGGTISIDSLGNYTYTPALDYYGTDKFIYTIKDRCGNADTAVIYIEVKAVLPVFVPQGFSPGGAHPTFVIYHAEKYTVNFKVYNRWGNLVYANNDYKAPDWWDGTSNQGLSIGNILPDGTYFYTIDLNNGTKLPAGYIVIKR